MNSESTRSSAIPLTDNRRAAIESFIAAVAFATMSTLVHGFGDKVAWPVVAFARISFTFVFAFISLRLTGAPLIIRGNRVLWTRSLVGTMGVFCTFYALTHMYVTDAVTIIATNPIWVMVILALVFNHRLPFIAVFDVILAIAGVWVMERPTFDSSTFPMFVALGAALISAIVKVSLSRLGGFPTVSVVTHHMGIATIATFCVSFFLVDRIVLVDDLAPMAWLILIPIGLLGTLAQLMMTSSFGRGNTLMVTIISLSNIGFAALYDVVFWDRTFDRWHALGAFMITTAIVLSVTRSSRETRAAVAEESYPPVA